MPTNEERATFAKKALIGYLEAKQIKIEISIEDYEISDLICDLLHLGDILNFHSRDLLDRAIMHYEEETKNRLTSHNYPSNPIT